MYVYAIFLKPNGNAIADDDYTKEFGRFGHFYGYKKDHLLSETLTILHRRRLCSAAPLARTDYVRPLCKGSEKAYQAYTIN